MAVVLEMLGSRGLGLHSSYGYQFQYRKYYVINRQEYCPISQRISEDITTSLSRGLEGARHGVSFSTPLAVISYTADLSIPYPWDLQLVSLSYFAFFGRRCVTIAKPAWLARRRRSVLRMAS